MPKFRFFLFQQRINLGAIKLLGSIYLIIRIIFRNEMYYLWHNQSDYRTEFFFTHINQPFGRVASAQIGMKACRQTAAFLVKLC